jgi:polyhydroxybutyrate depolymerase
MGMHPSYRESLLCIAALFVGAVAAGAAEPQKMTWNVAGLSREALVFAPSGAASTKSPVVFVFHGHGGTALAFSRHAAIQDAWPEAIVVYMQGLPTASRLDPKGKLPGWQDEPGQFGDRDLKFFDTVLGGLKEKYQVDENRVYSVGFSNGAFFTYLLWSQRAAVLAAVAPVAGRIWPNAHPTVPLAVIHIAGKKDDLVGIAQQQAAIEEDRKVNGATGPGEKCGPICTLYRSDKGTPVMTIIHEAGHVYPAIATPRIVGFFKNHSRS